MNSSLKDILKPSVAERIHLIEKIWNSIEAESHEYSTSLTAAQKKEIDRRLLGVETDKLKPIHGERLKPQSKILNDVWRA